MARERKQQEKVDQEPPAPVQGATPQETPVSGDEPAQPHPPQEIPQHVRERLAFVEAEKEKRAAQRKLAGKCPRNGAHPKTRVYKTFPSVRYCVCDDCGETWKQNRGPDGEWKVAA